MGESRKQEKLKNPFYALGVFVAKARVLYLEGFHSVHLKIRKMHDKTYAKNKPYKKWTDNRYSSLVHKTVLISFIVSFIAFSLLQNLFPYFFMKPNVALAGANSVTWTTQADFENNAVTTNTATTVSDNLAVSNDAALTGQVLLFSGAVNIAGGLDHTLALKNDGTVWAWGSNSYGQLGDNTTTQRLTPVQVKGPGGTGYLTGISAISVGSTHSLALKNDGTVWGWGRNGAGQLGDNTTTQRLTPVQVKGPGGTGYLTGISAISAESTSSLALKNDGTVWGWGANGVGQLGDNTTTDRYTPIQVLGPGGTGYLTDITVITVGWYHSLALKDDGTVWTWGINTYGQLGDNTTNQRLTPVQVLGPEGVGFLVGVDAISGSEYYSMALKDDGSVWSWGNNVYGNLGDNTTTQRSTPVQVLGPGGTGYLTGITEIGNGESHSLALKNDGTVWAWGSGSYGKLGNNSSSTQRTPIQVLDSAAAGNINNITSVAAGRWYSLALKNDSTVYAWGYNSSGQLGTGDTNSRSVPNSVLKSDVSSQLFSNAKVITGGDNQSLALKNDGTVWAWGSNSYGQLGDNTTTQRLTPVQVKGPGGVGYLTDITAITANSTHCMALKNDGTVWAWGENNAGQLGDNTITQRLTPVQVKASGGVGYLTGVNAIAASQYYSLALKNDGTVWGWGSNIGGQLGDNTTTQRLTPVQVKGPDGVEYLDSITSITTGRGHSLAIKSDGTVWAWGYNSFGQLGDNTTTQRLTPVQVKGPDGVGYISGITSIYGGHNHSLANKADGTVWAWGRNSDGQLGDNTTTQRNAPIQVLGPDGVSYLTGITAVSGGYTHSQGLKNDGTVWSWGDLYFYQKEIPYQVSGLSNIEAIGSGSYHTQAIKDDGTVLIRGQNNGAFGNNNTNSTLTPQNTLILIYEMGYSSPGIISNLRLYSATKATWSAIAWNGNTPDGTAIKFRTRSADSEANLATAEWSSYLTSSGSAITSAANTWLEIELTLETSVETSTPTLSDFTVTYDTLDSITNSNIILTKTDSTALKTSTGTTVSGGVPDAWSNSTSLRVTTNSLACTDCATTPTNLRPEVEIKSTATTFDGTGIYTATAGNTYVDIPDLTPGTAYHLRVRSIDDQGRVSAWTSYGNNAENIADFTIDQTAPTGTISVSNGAEFATSTSVTLNLSASDTGGSNLAQTRFSNDGTTWSDWETYAVTKAWTLTSGDGAKTVYGQFRDGAGNTSGQVQDNNFNLTVGGSTNSVVVDGSNVRLGGIQAAAPLLHQGYYWWDDDNTGACDFAQGATNGSLYAHKEWSDCGEEYTYGRTSFLKFTNAQVTAASLNINFQNSIEIYLDSVPDYGTLDVSDVGLSYYGRKSFTTQIGLNTFDVSDMVIADTTAERDVSAFRISTPGGALTQLTSPGLSLVQDYPYEASGNLISRYLDTSIMDPLLGIFSTSQVTKPTTTSITYKIRGGDQADLSDAVAWATAPSIAPGDSLPESLQGKRYLQYQATLTTSDNTKTPILDDVFIEVLNTTSDSITLDTTPPSDITNLKAYTSITKSNELLQSTWYPISEPYFEWDANVDPDLDHYEYCFSTTSNCTPSTSTNTSNFVTINPAITFEGTHYFRVVAVDGADQSSTTPTTFIYKYDATAPGAVTGLSASTTENDRVNLSWNAYGDGASPVENYKLERVKDPGNIYQIGDDWTTESGYAVFILTNTNFSDIVGSPEQGQTSIDASTQYQYRISVKDVSNPNYSIYQITKIYGMTNDVQDPSPVTGVLSAACDGTTDNIPTTSVPKCSDVDNVGFEITITWTPSSDTGTGVAGYNIYRSLTAAVDSYTQVGTVTSLSNYYHDNDTNNDTNETTRLNDYTTYYYRVTAFDAATTPNETDLIPVGTNNSTSASTPDVTAPTAPADLVATPLGLDPSGTKQRVELTWSASSDLKARNTEAGIGVKEYSVYRDTSEVGTFGDLVGTTANLLINDDGREDFTYYFYRLVAIDNVDNTSTYSEIANARTASSAVPTVPTNVSITAVKGDPTTDATVGNTVSISFNGSYAKNCLNGVRCLTKYELYRSTTNHPLATDWTDPTKATLVREYTLNTPTQDDRDTVYTHTDTDLTDATTYYYKVRALDNTPADPDGGPFYSGLSTVSTGTLNRGWDITPDVTGPMLPIELKVKDIHDDGLNYKRNIITWKRITTPTRNGVNDFKEYRIYRSTDGLAWTQLLVEGVNPLYNSDKEIGLATNYYMDLIPIAESNQYYYYYVTAVDDAGESYKYFNGSVINNYFNESAPDRDGEDNIIAVSLNPAIAKPSIITLGTGKKATVTSVGVSTAVIAWTTDQSADSLVEFRKSGTSDDFRAIGSRDYVVSHSIEIFGLSPNTTYEYRIISRNYLANDAIASGEELPVLATTGFNITPGLINTTTTTAEINWSTNLNASSAFIEYQLQRLVGDEPQSGTAGVSAEDLAADPKNHQVIIKGLRSNRAYTYKIKSISADGYLSEYPTGGNQAFETFRTKAYDTGQFTLTPSSSNVAERNITSTNAQIVWETAVPTTTWVDYGTTTAVYDVSAGNNDLTTQHVVLIDGLTPGETYYYRVRVKDANEVEYTSQEYSFRAVLKPKISNLQITEVTPYSVTINWETNIDTETIINWGQTTAYGEKKGVGGTTKSHEIKIDNLVDNTEYHFQILARDEVGEEVAGDDNVIRTPLDTEGPKIEDVKIDILPLGEGDEFSQVIISWKTNKPSTTLVQYDIGLVGGDYSKSSIEDTSLSTAHTVIIKELEVASTYHYRIVAKDKRNNQTISNDYTFVTPEKNKSIWQLIVRSLEETFSWVKNVGGFFNNLGKKTQ